MRTKLMVASALLAAWVIVPGSLCADALSIVNGGFEAGSDGSAGAPGWTDTAAGTPGFWTVADNDPGSTPDPSVAAEGSLFLYANRLAGGEGSQPSSSTLTQTITLSAENLALVATGSATIALDFKTYDVDDYDLATITLTFLDASDVELGSITTGVLANDYANGTTYNATTAPWAAHNLAGAIPDVNTAKVRIDITTGPRLGGTATNLSFDDFTGSISLQDIEVLSSYPDSWVTTNGFPRVLGAVLLDGASAVDTNSVALILDGTNLVLAAGDVVKTAATTTVSHAVSSLDAGTHTVSLVYAGMSPSTGPFTNTWSFGVVDSSVEPVRVFLLAGQSNMRGQGENSELTHPCDAAQTNVAFWNNGTWEDLAPGFGNLASQFGPELTFGYTVKQALPSAEIRLVKYAANGTALYNDWSPSGGPQYTEFMSTARAALADLDANGVYYEVSGMLWLQGEFDAYESQGAAYETNLRNFIADMRTQFDTPDLPFYIARVRTWWDNAARDQAVLVRAAQVTVAETTDNVEWFDTDSYDPLINSGHYNTPGQLNIGIDFANTYLASVMPSTIELTARTPVPSVVFAENDLPMDFGGVLVDGVSMVDTNSIQLLLDGTNLVLAAGDVVKTAATTTVSHAVSSLEAGVHTLSLVYEGLSPAEGPFTRTWAFTVTGPTATGGSNVSYVDATTGNTLQWNGSSFAAFTPDGAGANWTTRTGYGNDSTVIQSQYSIDSPLLKTTVSGLADATYKVYAYMWVENQSWRMGADLSEAIPLPLYAKGDYPSISLYVHYQDLAGADTWGNFTSISPVYSTNLNSNPFGSNTVLLANQNRRLMEIYLGTVSGTEISVYVDDDAAATDQPQRTWYDGIGYERVGATVDPVIQAVSVSGTTLSLEWTSETAGTYRIMHKTNLTDAVWTPVKTGISGGAPTSIDSVDVGSGSQEFFRIEGE